MNGNELKEKLQAAILSHEFTYEDYEFPIEHKPGIYSFPEMPIHASDYGEDGYLLDHSWYSVISSFSAVASVELLLEI